MLDGDLSASLNEVLDVSKFGKWNAQTDDCAGKPLARVLDLMMQFFHDFWRVLCSCLEAIVTRIG